jgi:hypothetical protein
MTSAILAIRYMIQQGGIIQETNAAADGDMTDGNVQVLLVGAKQEAGGVFRDFARPEK